MIKCQLLLLIYRNDSKPLPVFLTGGVKTEDIRPYATFEMEHKYEDDSPHQVQEESDYSEVVIGPRINLNLKQSTAADGKSQSLAPSSSCSTTGSHIPSEHNGPVATNDYDIAPYYVHHHRHSIQSSATESEEEYVYVN